MRSLSLVMSECFLSGRGQGHVSNFYIVDLENFATASRRYTGDINNSTVVGLFMTPIRRWKRLEGVTVECTTHRPTLTLQLHNFDLFTTCRTGTALLRGNWQDFNWHDALHGPSAIAQLLVCNAKSVIFKQNWYVLLLCGLSNTGRPSIYLRLDILLPTHGALNVT